MSPQAQDALVDEVRGLEAIDLEGLRALWKARYGQTTQLRSSDFLRSQLAWRMQAEALGGMDDATSELLARKPRVERGPKLQVGSRLAREWKGQRVEVAVVEGGFLCGETLYASLSEAARAVTGVRWNGPRFFGLRTETPDAR